LEARVAEHLLVIDDDTRLVEMLAAWMDGAGVRVTARHDVRSGLAAAKAGGFDAVILDVMLPDGDGVDACRSLRAVSDVPILMLTARGDPTDRIVGLEIGADDYLAKPFNPRELLARVRAVLRRARPTAAADVLRFGRLELDRGAHVARLDGNPVSLTGHQLALLFAFGERAGRVMTRDDLMQAVRGDDLDAFDRSIDVHISRIRAAIEDDPKQPRRILTQRGVGYLFAERQP
jgi:two-component system phosphate regulon response regulator OmpR